MTDLPPSLQNYIANVMPTLDGWCSPAKAEALARAVLVNRPSLVVEIGVFAGRSLISLALAASFNQHGLIVGIDPWSGDASTSGYEDVTDSHLAANREWWRKCDHLLMLNRCVGHCRDASVLHNTTLMRTTAEAALPAVASLGPISLLHIDGNHSEPSSTFDVTHYVPLVAPGGTVIFDDTNWATTKRAQTLLAGMCDFDRFIESPGQQCAFYRKR